jgi:alkylation response protein AidB-like acyl-CoA dehydrogenase
VVTENKALQWRHYPYQTGDLNFPDDEGVHPDNPYGWWYLNMHLDDEAGDRVILFTSFVSTVNEQLGSIADLSRGKHLDQYQVGEITTETDFLDVQFHHGNSAPNFLRQIKDEPFHYEFYYALSGYEFTLTLEATKPPYALAGSGLVQQLPATYSYYYVQPRLKVSGTMKRDDGTTTAITGIGWLDRQWYPSSNPGTDMYMGHFWSAIHLSDGTDIAAYRCLGEGGTSAYPLFEVFGPDNSYTHYAANSVVPLQLFETPPIGNGPIKEFQFPLSAKVVHEPTGTDLTLTIAARNPMDNALALGEKGCFFEGGFIVTGTHNNQSVTGDAFVEVSLFGARLLMQESDNAPMKSELTEEQKLLQESAAKFFQQECSPEDVMALLKSGERIDEDFWNKLVQQGYLGLIVPENCGGLGSGLKELIVIGEEMGKASVPGPYLSNLWASSALTALIDHPDAVYDAVDIVRDRLRDRLKDIVLGKSSVTVVYSDQGGYPDPVELPLDVREEGRDLIISSDSLQAQDAEDADYLLLTVRDPDARSCLVLMPSGSEGIVMDRVSGLDGLRPIYRLKFSAVVLNRDEILVIGEVAESVLDYATSVASLAASADRIGGMQSVLRSTVDYLADAEALGQSIPSFAAAAPRANNLLQRVQTCRTTLHWAASALEDGTPEAQNAVTLARMSVTRASTELGDLINELHEGMGLSWEHDLNLFRTLPPFFDAIAVPLASLKES